MMNGTGFTPKSKLAKWHVSSVMFEWTDLDGGTHVPVGKEVFLGGLQSQVISIFFCNPNHQPQI